MHIIYFIPIRKGSKCVPNKNMKILGGKPLVAWILDAIISSNTADEIWVATDSDEAEAYLKKTYPIVNVFRRSDSSATDTSPVIEGVMEFLQFRTPDLNSHFILTQATSPFTKTGDLEALCKVISDSSYDSYVSCKRMKKFIWSEEGFPLSYSLENKPMRQQYNGVLVETGAFYVSSVKHILLSGTLLSGRIKIIVTEDSEYIDIDTPTDWKLAEAIIAAISNK